MWIIWNTALNSLVGLENLSSMGGLLKIYQNENLISLDELSNLIEGSIEDLNITYNASLASCAVESICDYLAIPNGTIEIHDNAPGCNNQAEVELACETISVEAREIEGEMIEVSCVPNPLSSAATIHLTLPDADYVKLGIYNNTGRKIENLHSGFLQAGEHSFVWDARGLGKGMYLLRLETDGMSVSRKILLVK